MLCDTAFRSITRLGRLACTALFAAGIGDTAFAAGPACKPTLAITGAKFSSIHPETRLRTWTATVLVDAKRCASHSGRFEILFSRQKENAPDADFTEPFEWRPGTVQVSVDFWADESVDGYWATAIDECPCQR